MIRQPISYPSTLAISIFAIVLTLFCYELMSRRQLAINPTQTTLPSLTRFYSGFQQITKPDRENKTWLGTDVKATYGRLALGLLLGVGLSVAIGVPMGAYPWVKAFFAPTILFLAKIPPTAMLAVYLALFGFEQLMFVAMVGLSVFFTLAQSIYSAAQQDVSEYEVYKAYSLGASSPEVIYEVLWKQILPRVIDAVRLQIGPAMVFLIAAEFAVGDEGFGYRIRIQGRRLNFEVVYLYLIFLGGTGLGMDWLLTWTRRKLCPWFGG